MDRKRFKKQVAFILEADKEKNILRQTHLSGHGRRENDAEHAWHMAMMIYLLKEYANAEFDLAKTMMMALIHDIVEIDAGDTYAYDTAGLATQAEREEKAAERIFGLLPDDQRDEYYALWREFEDDITYESRFASILDRMQPLLLNYTKGGIAWKEHGVHKEQVLSRNRPYFDASHELAEVIESVIEDAAAKGWLKA